MTNLLRITMPVNLFLLLCELFTEFYPGTTHNIHAQYLYFGLHGHTSLTRFIWPAIIMNCIATILFQIDWIRQRQPYLLFACALSVMGIWIEKGIGLIFAGFTPNPLGQLVEYEPNLEEIVVNLAVIALGTAMFTVMAKVAIAIQSDKMPNEFNGARRSIAGNKEPLPQIQEPRL